MLSSAFKHVMPGATPIKTFHSCNVGDEWSVRHNTCLSAHPDHIRLPNIIDNIVKGFLKTPCICRQSYIESSECRQTPVPYHNTHHYHIRLFRPGRIGHYARVWICKFNRISECISAAPAMTEPNMRFLIASSIIYYISYMRRQDERLFLLSSFAKQDILRRIVTVQTCCGIIFNTDCDYVREGFDVLHPLQPYYRTPFQSWCHRREL